jgi:large subunit ribosomal protein L31
VRGKVKQTVKEGIHPTFYTDAVVVCGSCGTTWQTGSTKKEVHVDVCSNCHPFFTGTQRIVDTAGQVERFTKRLQARETLTPTGEVRGSKRERRALERAKRSGMLEATQPEPAAEASAPEQPVAEAPAVVTAETPAAEGTAEVAPRTAAPRERKPRPPRPPRERRPREAKPAETAPAASAAAPAVNAPAPEAETSVEIAEQAGEAATIAELAQQDLAASAEQAPVASAAIEPAPGSEASEMVSEGAPAAPVGAPDASDGDWMCVLF